MEYQNDATFAHIREKVSIAPNARLSIINSSTLEGLKPHWRLISEPVALHLKISNYDSTTVVGDVKIGDHTWIGPFCSLDGTAGLVIGRYCSVSLGCQLLTHDTVKWAVSGGKADHEYAPTKIGDCCFLGSYAVITKGVTIGDHCLIAAGAIVTKNVPSFSIVGGLPGRIIGKVILNNEGAVQLEYERKSS